MPRSGSTLLCNVLAQNSDFHVTPTSGLSELIRGTHAFWKQNPIIKASETYEKELTIIKHLFESYHSDTDRPIIFNKSRGWASQIELIENALQSEIKILTTLRKLTCVLASLEKLYRKELKIINSPMENNKNLATIELRLNTWSNSDGLVGQTFNDLKDAVMRGHRHKFYFLDFDTFTLNPKNKMKEIYDFIEQPYYNHDFNNIQQYTKENDAEHGFTDLHTIRSKIEPVEDDSKQILGEQWNHYKDFQYNF